MASRRMRLRHELVARREHILKVALERPCGPLVTFDRAWGHTRFGNLRRYARTFSNIDLERRFLRLLGHSEHWVRTPESWSPRVRGDRALARSLTAHLMCRFPVPQIFDEVWDADYTGGLDWYLALAGGMGLRRLSNMGEFPVPLTRRQAHLLGAEHSRQSLPAAVRSAQLRGFGSTRAVAEAMADTRWGRSFARNRGERRRRDLLAWMAQQGVAPAEVRRLVRFFEANEDQGPLALRRSLSRVLRECAEWEAVVGPPPRRRTNVARTQYMDSPLVLTTWEPSGIPAYRNGKIGMVELGSAMELIEEGRRLKHCVSGYAHHCVVGRCAIWSLRIDGESVYTIEVRLPHGDIVQMRGVSNCDPGPAGVAFMRKWAKQAGLRIRPTLDRYLADVVA